MIKRLLTVLLFFVVCNSTIAQTDKEYTATLTKMFEVSGSKQSYEAAVKQMFVGFKQQYATVDASIWEDLEGEFLKRSIDDLADMLVPVYVKYLTLDDLKELIKFYETPVGKKYSQNTPFIIQESMVVGQEWGTKVGLEFQQKMKEKGY